MGQVDGEFSTEKISRQVVVLDNLPVFLTHGVRCADHALIVQVRADFLIETRST